MHRTILPYTIYAFLLNFFWESWHAFGLYAGINELAPSAYVALLTYAATIDALILTAMFIGGRLLWRRWTWYRPLDTKKYAYIISVTVAVAIWIEYRALYLHDLWSYTTDMPTVFSLGVSPLTQLAVTGLIGIFLLRLSREDQ